MSSTEIPKVKRPTLLEEIQEYWLKWPHKAIFLTALLAWIGLFHFLGNSTLGYINTRSLFGWLNYAYRNSQDDEHGMLIPFVVLGLCWWKREELFKAARDGWWPALGIVLIGLIIHVLGYVVQQTRISVIGFFLGFYGLTGLVWGREWLVRSFFPMFLFGFCVPLNAVAEIITQPMRLMVAAFSVGISHHVLGIEVFRNGSQVVNSSGIALYEVAPACSGMRSLVTLLAITITAVLNRENRWSGDLTQVRRDGVRIHVSTRWALGRDAAGKPAKVLITDNDITLRKQAEELMQSEAERLEALVQVRTMKLQETIGELEAFSYSISHDMRAPLRAMQGYAQALLEDYNETLNDEAKDYLSKICRASSRMDSLIQDVLAYSKVAKGEIHLVPVDLERLIEDILPNHPELQPPKANVIIHKPLHRPLGHEAYLTQCVTNLLGNAVKFVPAGVTPEIHIRSERVGDKVRFWFEDNGIGIEPSHHERIFQIFGQVYANKKYGGTGIGLAIVRKAAQRMNGEVGVESVLNKGSRFWILLNEAKE